MKKSTLIGLIVFGVIVVLVVIIGTIAFSNKGNSSSSTGSSESKNNGLKVDFDELSTIKIGDYEFSPKGTIADTKLDITFAYTTSSDLKEDVDNLTIKPDEDWHAQLGFDSANIIDIHVYGKNKSGNTINIKDIKLENASYSVGDTGAGFDDIVKNEYNITFAKNIKLGKSTVAEVEKAYGVEAVYDSLYEADEIDIYSPDHNKTITFSFVNDILVKYQFFG